MTPTAKSLTKAAVQQIKRESLEVVKTAKKQVSSETPKPSQNKSESKKEITPQEEAKIKNAGKRRLEQLEDEMEQYRRVRKRRDEEIEEQRQLEERQAEQEKASQQEPITTGSKPKKGMRGMVGKIKKLQMGPEARAGKGKS